MVDHIGGSLWGMHFFLVVILGGGGRADFFLGDTRITWPLARDAASVIAALVRDW